MPRAKRARHDDLEGLVSLKARLPFISQSARGALLRLAKDEKLPDIVSRNVVREARDRYVQLSTPYGPVHQHLDLGGGIQTEIQHPMAMLYAAGLKGNAFAELLRRTVSRFPCSPTSPWKLVIYIDEVTPGNQLAYAHERKTWAWYWSFLEFEQSISSEDMC